MSSTTGITLCGMDPGGRGVDGEFADRDFDTADALVADAEDALGVGGPPAGRRRLGPIPVLRSAVSTSFRMSSTDRNTPRGRPEFLG